MIDDIKKSHNNYLVPCPSNIFEKSTEMVIKSQGCLIEPMYKSDFPERDIGEDAATRSDQYQPLLKK